VVDTQTHRPVRIAIDGLAGPYITVSEKQLGGVRSVLQSHGVKHWVDHYAVSVDGRPALMVIYLEKQSDVQLIQAFLDSAC